MNGDSGQRIKCHAPKSSARQSDISIAPLQDRREDAGTLLGPLAQFAISMVALVLGAQITIPTRPVPITFHTMVLLLILGLVGQLTAIIASSAYVIAIIAGAPILSGFSAAGGTSFLRLPSAGYLLSFILVSVLFGSRCYAAVHASTFCQFLLLSLGLHAVVLATGGAWLAARMGQRAMVMQTFFLLPGAIIKSLLATAILVGCRYWIIA